MFLDRAQWILKAGLADVYVFRSMRDMAAAAADRAARLIQNAIEARGQARVLLATGNSQVAFINALMQRPEVDWSRVDAFHIDEYVGLPSSHPASFRRWIRSRVEDRAPLRKVHYIDGTAADLDVEIRRYSALLHAAPVDVAFVGFGENGHIGFNEPGAALFDEPATLQVVELDETSRRQQVGEGHFPDVDLVPRQAVTVTCSGLIRADAWVCCVPELRKAQTVRRALLGPVTTQCPASVVRRHAQASVFLDQESASLYVNEKPAP